MTGTTNDRIRPNGGQYLRWLLTASFFAAVFALAVGRPSAEDWPTYRHDNHRSGVTAETLRLPLALRHTWVHAPNQTPKATHLDAPAQQDFWHDKYNLKPKMTHDRALHVAVVGDSVYVASFVNDKVFRLDAASGEEQWSFFTDAPVRTAPTAVDGKVYIGSDDGAAYSLSASDGSLLWKYRASARDERIFGNGRMISRWPVRTSVLVEDGVAFFCAGLFPNEKVYLCAVGADDGTDTGAGRWKKTVSIAPQGYLLLSPTRLYVPTSRTSPAVFGKADGSYVGQIGGKGGTFALLVGDRIVSGPNLEGTMEENPQATGDRIASSAGLQMVATTDRAYLVTESEITTVDRAKRSTIWKEQAACPYSLILADDTLFAGGEGEVKAFRAVDGAPLWSAAVSGKVYGLAAANGRLFVSTDQGTIYCFTDASFGAKPNAAGATMLFF